MLLIISIYWEYAYERERSYFGRHYRKNRSRELKNDFRETMAKKKKKKVKQKQHEEIMSMQDGEFYFIAGYTPGGMPFGITWDQVRAEGLVEDEEDLDDDLFL